MPSLTLRQRNRFREQQALSSLQTFDLRWQQAPSWDLSCCTRLTELSLSIPLYFQRLSLPHGDHVQLQGLKACNSATTERGNEDFVLEHFTSASKLTCLVFIATYPSNLRDGRWPSYMPRLQNVSVQSLHSALPEQWLSYPQLTYLDLTDLQQAHLPTWFSKMTQLSSLHLSTSNITVFPDCLLSLSQLQGLYLDDTEVTVIPSDITRMHTGPTYAR